MTRHEAQALVIQAIGALPLVRRIDYVVEAGGEGVVVEVAGGYRLATLRTALEEMTVEEYRTYFAAVLRNTERYLQAQMARHDEPGRTIS